MVPTVVALKRRRGKPTDELLAYHEGRGAWRDVTSSRDQPVAQGPDRRRATLRRTSGPGTARCLQRWDSRRGPTPKIATQAVVDVVKEVAETLGNTPAVCRASYIDPRVISKFENGTTIKPATDRLAAKGTRKDFADREAIEKAVIRLISLADRGLTAESRPRSRDLASSQERRPGRSPSSRSRTSKNAGCLARRPRSGPRPDELDRPGLLVT